QRHFDGPTIRRKQKSNQRAAPVRGAYFRPTCRSTSGLLPAYLPAETWIEGPVLCSAFSRSALAENGPVRETSVPVSQRTGTIFLEIDAFRTADIQRIREADSFLLVTPNSPMKAGMSLVVQNPFIWSKRLVSSASSAGVPQLGIIFPHGASSVRPQNVYGV